MLLLHFLLSALFASIIAASDAADVEARAYVETITDFPKFHDGTPVTATVIMTISTLFTRGTITGFDNDMNFVLFKRDDECYEYIFTAPENDLVYNPVFHISISAAEATIVTRAHGGHESVWASHTNVDGLKLPYECTGYFEEQSSAGLVDERYKRLEQAARMIEARRRHLGADRAPPSNFDSIFNQMDLLRSEATCEKHKLALHKDLEELKRRGATFDNDILDGLFMQTPCQRLVGENAVSIFGNVTEILRNRILDQQRAEWRWSLLWIAAWIVVCFSPL